MVRRPTACPRAIVHGAVSAGDHSLQTPYGQGKGCETEVGLGLATTGREEEQVDESGIRGPLAVSRVSQ